MALAQMERGDEFVSLRCQIARLYEQAIENCTWLTAQKTPPGYRNSYWTYGLLLNSEKSGISWSEFRNVFLELGGEPFYAAWLPNYREPAFSDFIPQSNPYENGCCPVAEKIHPNLLQLKTNFGSLDEGKEQAKILKRTIQVLETKSVPVKRQSVFS